MGYCKDCGRKSDDLENWRNTKNGKILQFCDKTCAYSYESRHNVLVVKAGSFSDSLVGGMQKAENFMDGTVQKSSAVKNAIEEFKKGYEKGREEGCFITTATCQSRNLPDDCHELTSLRNFRDTFMKKDELMKSEVEEYYRIAPTICKNIDSKDDSAEIYESIYQKWLKNAVSACDSGEKQKAHDIYREMVLELKKLYL